MLSVIIPTLNEEEVVGECLKSLKDQNFDGRYEVIIVDGDSSDRTREIAEIYADKVISQRSEGIGGARRDGVEASRGDVFVFTDADTIYDENWLSIISENLRRYDVSTGPVLFYDENFRSDLLQYWRKIYLLFHSFNFYWLIGSNMAIREEAYQRINGHRDISILEDFDISVKTFKEREIRSKYDKNQRVYTSARRLDNLFSYFLIYVRGYYYYLTKHYDHLLDYPRVDKMDLKTLTIAEIENLNSFFKLHSRISRK